MPNKPNQPLLLCASPRQGNCLEAARLFAHGFNAASALPELRPTRLADFRIEPCIDCGSCQKGKSCPFLGKDDSAGFFEALLRAPLIAITAPIYFYHLPAPLKALLDRCQQYYIWKKLGLGGLEALPKRTAFVMLLAAREQGEQLFTGSLLTLKLALAPFNISLASPLLLRGLEQSGDLNMRPDYQAALHAYGAEAAQRLNGAA